MTSLVKIEASETNTHELDIYDAFGPLPHSLLPGKTFSTHVWENNDIKITEGKYLPMTSSLPSAKEEIEKDHKLEKLEQELKDMRETVNVVNSDIHSLAFTLCGLEDEANRVLDKMDNLRVEIESFKSKNKTNSAFCGCGKPISECGCKAR